ncbi:MAG TPA: lipid II flippase MurJ, partial [Erysipelothrix sp.]|nr:lipid II flippase MurJ [Erysipelothrix sp.]
IVDKSMGSTLVKGSISALNYAEKLSGLIQGIFIAAINTVMYPIFSREAIKEDHEGLKKTIIQSINLILLITVPSAMAMMILSTPIVKIAFERGEFDRVATLMTSSALTFTTVRMISGSINMSLNNVYYSLKDTKTPLIISMFSVVVNIVLNLVLIRPLKHNGLALATSVSSIFGMIVSIYFLRKKLGSFGFKASVIVFIKTFIASLIMGAVVFFTHSYLVNRFVMTKVLELVILLSVSLLGLVIYLILIYIFDVEELNFFIGTLKKRLKG